MRCAAWARATLTSCIIAAVAAMTDRRTRQADGLACTEAIKLFLIRTSTAGHPGDGSSWWCAGAAHLHHLGWEDASVVE